MIFIYIKKIEIRRARRKNEGSRAQQGGRQQGEKSRKVLVKMKTTLLIYYYLFDPHVFALTLTLCIDGMFGRDLQGKFRGSKLFCARVTIFDV